MHWHGINQRGNEWNDGVPGVSQCPIPPGSSYTYRFRAAPYGSTWYHSHYSSQYAGGLWGPLVIYGPNTADYDIDLGPVTLNDYYHRDYYSILEDVMGTDTSKVRPASDNNLINGKMNFNCDGAANSSASKNQSSNTVGSCVENAELSKFKFTSGKKHRLRLVNTGTAAIQKFSIDNHTMTVIANDFIPIEPYETTIVTLAVSRPRSVPAIYRILTAQTGRSTQRRDRRSNWKAHGRRLDALLHHQRPMHRASQQPSGPGSNILRKSQHYLPPKTRQRNSSSRQHRPLRQR